MDKCCDNSYLIIDEYDFNDYGTAVTLFLRCGSCGREFSATYKLDESTIKRKTKHERP
jgi:hypothetical protein